MPDTPPITLDTTLAELYNRGSTASRPARIALVLCAADTEMELSSSIPRNTKFLYQDSTFSNAPKHLSPDAYKETQRHLAMKYLSLVPQHDAFAAGNMDVILFDLDNSEELRSLSHKEAEETISNLSPGQRPHLLFFQNPTDISLQQHGIHILAPKMDLDGLEGFPCTVNLDTHYFLNSKAGLCMSGLPTPKCELLELEDFSCDAQSCCAICRSEIGSLVIPQSCTGSRRPWLSSQISRIISRISNHPLPFILKNQQTFGGGGIFKVSSSKDRETLVGDLCNRILPKLFSQVNASNAHLKPATLLLSEVITDPIGDYGLTFFVTKAGECIFLCVTEQTVDESAAWIGSNICYSAQDALKQKFSTIMHDIGAWLHRHGYYGPIGADILETAPDTSKPNSANLHIVDLNVRTSGSLVLGLLGGHFFRKMRLPQASSFSVNIKMNRKQFIEKLAKRYQERRIVIASWYEDVESGVSFANLIIGAEDKERLEKEIEAVKQYAIEIHF